MPQTHNELVHVIRREIAATGPISCARFMQLALDHPVHGYYHRSAEQIGCQGDFYTSVSVGNLFGQLLAFRFAGWLQELLGDALHKAPRPGTDSPPRRPQSRWQLVEAGAHDGRLALDALSWFQRMRPDLLAQVEYWIIEPSLARRRRQEEMLRSFAERVRWYRHWDELPPGGVRGVIFSNELLDAFPAFRLGWDAEKKAWFEWRIDWTGERLDWTRAAHVSAEQEQDLKRLRRRGLSPELLAVLPDGFTIERCPAAHVWWSQAAQKLRQGKLLAFDYGFEWHEFFMPHRQNGTLRGYFRHRLTSDPLHNPGEQDLTAHVNFTDLHEAGEYAGLSTECFCAQSEFLTRIVAEIIQDPSRFGSWTQQQVRQFQTLTHPDHLGRSFRVLLQGR